MQIVWEWVFRHPVLFLIGALAAFVLWLAAPITWRDGEGSPLEDGEKIRAVYGCLAASTGNLWFVLLGKAGRQ